MKRKLIALVLAIATLTPLTAGCTNNSQTATEATTEATTTPAAPTVTYPYDEMESRFAEPAYTLARRIVKDYWSKSGNYVKGDRNSNGQTTVWGYASYVEAMAEAYRLYPDDKVIAAAYERSLASLEAYKVTETITVPSGEQYNVSYYNASAGNRGDYYYDDDAWICIQFLNAYELLKDEQYLTLAEETLEFLWTGWDDVLGGGIYWDKSYSGKNTCANGPIAIGFLWAYQITGKAEYLERGKMIYDWCREVLLENNLYCDSIGLDGSKNGWKAAYNQGVMIYAGAQLYEITGEEIYLTQTRATNQATVNHMFKGSGNSVTMSGNPIYKSWCIGWLVRGFMKFYAVDPEKDTDAMDKMNVVLAKNLSTKTRVGYYDPYFMTGDWSGESVTDVLQPCGICSVLCLSTYYDEVLSQAKN